jgi:hypothetical protein
MAICLHNGDSPRAGHYLSVVRNLKDGIWRRYNDRNVTVGTKQLDQKFFNQATPYVLFYKGDKMKITKTDSTRRNIVNKPTIIVLDSCSESDNGKLFPIQV